MARTKIKKHKIVTAYRASLRPYMRIDDVLLFGSAARGSATQESDLDVIVLSRDFKRMAFMERLQLLNRARTGAALHIPMDIVGYTPEEFASFQESESPQLRRVYREARSI